MTSASFMIGGLVFEPGRGALRAADGVEALLRPKAAQVLLYLAERGGEIASRHALIEAVWPGIYVNENGLTQCVADIRRALGAEEGLLRTLPRRGYVLDIAPTEVTQPALGRTAGGIPVLAMLPLRLPEACDADLSTFAAILLDGVVGTLATLREPVVISASSTRHLTGTAEDVPTLARRIGADYLVAGELRRIGDRVRLSVELVEATRGAVVWHRVYELTADGLFDAPDELATAIAHTLVPRLRDAEMATALRRRHDLSAYHLMLEGQRLMARLERAGFDQAGDMLRRAIVLDPGFAAGHVALANWHSLRIGQRWSDDPAADARMLEDEVHLALRLDGGQARALALLGHSCAILHRDYGRAQQLLDRAVDMAPNDAETCLWASPTLAYTDRAEEGVRTAERAIRLSPEDPLLFRYQHFLSIAHYAKGNLEAAADWGMRSLRSNGDYTSNLAVTAAALGAQGRIEEARLPARRLIELAPGFTAGLATRRVAYRDQAQRERYGQHLIAAGIPP